MHRVKWLLVEVYHPHKTLANAILSFPFQEERNCGFNLLERDNTSLKARFIEKIATVELIVTPYGESSRIETTRYLSTDFRLFLLDDKKRYYLMEVSAPPRSLRPLVDGLAGAAGTAVVAEAQIPLLELYRVIHDSNPVARLVRIKASQIRLTPNSVARVDVISTKDAASDLKGVFGNAASIDRIKIERPFGPLMHSIEISKNGVAVVDEEYRELASALLRKWLYNHYAPILP